MALRTASYAEAQRSAPRAPDEGGSSTYRGVTTKSQAFYKKMDESHAEAERLRQQCRAAANASSSRAEEERVDFKNITSTILDAKAMSSFARSATIKNASGKVDGAGAPAWLSHLQKPEVLLPSSKTLPAIQSGLPAPSPRSDVALPGAMEPYQSKDDYSRQVQDALQAEAQPSAVALPSIVSGEVGWQESAMAQDLSMSQSQPGPRGIAEENASLGGSEEQLSQKESKFSDGEDEDESDFDDSEESDVWPPSPPVLRFKMRMQFSSRFKPTEAQKDLFLKMNEDLDERFVEGKESDMKDRTLGWLNQVFAMNVETEYQFEIGFPIIILTMLDAIYPKRVRWREVDWRFQYKRALQKNFAVLESIWAEVNMEKAREFRVENTPLRLEAMPAASLQEKLEFLRLMKRWYDQRIHHAGPYDPLAKRLDFVEQCKAWGHTVKFPPWIHFDKEYKAKPSDPSENREEYQKMPEYKRLIYFLGCQEYQTM